MRQAKRLELEEKADGVLTPELQTQYRALAARCNYLALDRPDLGYASKELCRDFAEPSWGSFVRLKRVVRYLVHKPRLVWHFDFEAPVNDLNVHVDTDFGWM